MTTMMATDGSLVLPESAAWFHGPTATEAAAPADSFFPPPETFLVHPLFESFAAIARRAPDALALRSGARQVSYGELHAQALALAGRIVALPH